jgi:hypothetical protein
MIVMEVVEEGEEVESCLFLFLLVVLFKKKVVVEVVEK